MMVQVTEKARAKINLTLQIVGRRSDGYHELRSLVVFADIADELVLDPGDEFALQVDGPFAQMIEGGNLIERVCGALEDLDPNIRTGAIHLEKNLPVAAGIGGGSADAAAVLRVLKSANPEISDSFDWMGCAASIGADVPVCYVGRSAIMEGIGEKVRPVHTMPEFSLLLVNSGAQISTADIFGRLDAPVIGEQSEMVAGTEIDGGYDGQLAFDFDELVDHMKTIGNDLEQPALEICPEITEIKGAIVANDGCAHSSLSGSGATCFGVFALHQAALAAEKRMQLMHPDWWVKAVRVV